MFAVVGVHNMCYKNTVKNIKKRQDKMGSNA